MGRDEVGYVNVFGALILFKRVSHCAIEFSFTKVVFIHRESVLVWVRGVTYDLQ